MTDGRLQLLPVPPPPPRGVAAASASAGRPIDAVVFDMDGLLIDSEVLAMQALARAGEALALDLPVCFRHLMIGVPVDGCRRLLVERYGPEVDADRLFAIAASELASSIDAGELRLKPGVEPLLHRLERDGVPMAVATSSARAKALHHLAAVGIRHRFDRIVTRDDVARGKPFPDLFLQAAQALGVVPARALALEDSYNGVRAARAAGLPVVMVPDLLAPTDEMRSACHAVIDRLDDLLSMLAPGAGLRQTMTKDALP